MYGRTLGSLQNDVCRYSVRGTGSACARSDERRSEVFNYEVPSFRGKTTTEL